MDKLSDLELITAIAKIEGFDYTIRRDSVCPGDPTDVIVHKLTDVFDPLTDKALLWDLRLKYKVEIDDDCKTCRIWVIPGGDCFVVDYETDEDLPRAMLEVIVESKRNG